MRKVLKQGRVMLSIFRCISVCGCLPGVILCVHGPERPVRVERLMMGERGKHPVCPFGGNLSFSPTHSHRLGDKI